MFVMVDLRTNETTNTTWPSSTLPTAATVANTIWPPTSTVKSSTLVVNTPCFPLTVAISGTPTSLRSPRPARRTFVPTNPGQEGLGEGSIVQATNGDIISMSWFPYVGGDLKLDKFYAILYDASEEEWKWCYNRITEPFYDRSWQVEVIGPISSSIGDGEWASIVVSNFWHQTQNAGGQISVDGLNYYPFQFPGRDGGDPPIELDLDFTAADLPAYWDVNKPHKEMRAFPCRAVGRSSWPTTTTATPRMDTTLSWNELEVQFPSEYCQIDRKGTLHCVANSGTTYPLHVHGWCRERANHTYTLDATASQIEEWEFQANGELDQFILNVRYQSTEGPDVDTVYHVRGYSTDMSPDTSPTLAG